MARQDAATAHLEAEYRKAEVWLHYLESLHAEGKDATDPTYLMQAFELTRREAEQTIYYWTGGQDE